MSLKALGFAIAAEVIYQRIQHTFTKDLIYVGAVSDIPLDRGDLIWDESFMRHVWRALDGTGYYAYKSGRKFEL